MKTIGGAAALAAAVILAAIAPARSQVCSTTCSDYYEGHCVQHTTSCTTGPSTNAPAASYGAIAYGRTSAAWGYSYRWGSRARAEGVAKKSCDAHGDDCEVVVWFEHKCGAVAASDAPDAFWGLGDSEDQAGAEAKSKCIAGGGTNCAVQVSHCSR
jgi:uncharacterized protein DUF4189